MCRKKHSICRVCYYPCFQAPTGNLGTYPPWMRESALYSLGLPSTSSSLVLVFSGCPLSLFESLFSASFLFSDSHQLSLLYTFFFSFFWNISYPPIVSPITYSHVISNLCTHFLSPKLYIHIPSFQLNSSWEILQAPRTQSV